MVNMEDAVIARLESHGERFEILVDPDLASEYKKDLMGLILVLKQFLLWKKYLKMLKRVIKRLRKECLKYFKARILWKLLH